MPAWWRRTWRRRGERGTALLGVVMRFLAIGALVAAVGGIGLTGLRLAAILSADEPAQLAAEGEAAAVPDGTTRTAAADEARPFLAIYGTPPPARLPARPADAEAEAPEPDVAYTLRGVVASGTMRWAVLGGPEADLVVREGDVLPDGARVARVHAEGVELGRSGGRTETIGFSAETPVRRAEIADAASQPVAAPSESARPVTPGRGPPRGAILFQDMSGAEIVAAMEAAEQRRIDRGWVTR